MRASVASMSSANTGPPMSAVTMPTGSSRGSNRVRAAVSAQTRKIAPASAESGSSARCRGPTSSRTACGSTSPTKPIAPLTATIAPVSSAVPRSSQRAALPTCTPSAAAAVSPNANASSVRALASSGTPMTTNATPAIATEGQSAPASEPSSQLRISR